MAKKQATGPEQTQGPEYPTTKYRKCKVTSRCPNGYEARQVPDAEAEGLLSKDWKDSPEEL